MPMSPHRPTLAGLFLLFLGVVALGGAAAASAEPGANTGHPIVQTALKYEGTWQDQCWIFVKKVVFEATGQEMGYDYRLGFLEAGAVEVSSEDARAGDIIQIADDAYTLPDADYDGLHTFIIVANRGDGVFDGIDSNSNFDGMVRLREGYVPGDAAARYGLDFHIYRFPAGASPQSAANAEGAPATVTLARGDRAVVASPEGLNLRNAPGIDQPVIAVLKDKTAVTVLSEAPVTLNGRKWLSVRTPVGDGWVAADFVRPHPGGPVTASGNTTDTPGGSQGQGRPLTRYRVVVASVAISGD